MICKNPFVRVPTGITKKMTILSSAAADASTPFPCGKCQPCKTNKARIWKHRLVLESYTNKPALFVTLTYNDTHVPDHYTLVPEDVNKFIRRVKNSLKRKLRYYYVGEYGESRGVFGRPHYHLFLYGMGNDELDKEIIRSAWRDDEGRDIGFVHIGKVTPDSASYIVGYVTKGLTKGDIKGRDYSKYIGFRKIPEFARMSRKPGIGHDAIKVIARTLEKSKWYKNDKIIREIPYGKRREPIGRYLTRILADEMNTDDAIFDVEFWQYQQDLFENFMDKEGNFKEELVLSGEGKRRALEARKRFFKRRRILDDQILGND